MKPGIKSTVRNLTLPKEATPKEVVSYLAAALGFKLSKSKNDKGTSTYKQEGNTAVRLADHRTYLQTWVDMKMNEYPNKFDIVIEGTEDTDFQTQVREGTKKFTVLEYVYKLSDLNDQKLRTIAYDILGTLKGGSYGDNAKAFKRDKLESKTNGVQESFNLEQKQRLQRLAGILK